MKHVPKVYFDRGSQESRQQCGNTLSYYGPSVDGEAPAGDIPASGLLLGLNAGGAQFEHSRALPVTFCVLPFIPSPPEHIASGESRVRLFLSDKALNHGHEVAPRSQHYSSVHSLPCLSDMSNLARSKRTGSNPVEGSKHNRHSLGVWERVCCSMWCATETGYQNGPSVIDHTNPSNRRGVAASRVPFSNRPKHDRQCELGLEFEIRKCTKCGVNEAFWSCQWCEPCIDHFVNE